MRKLKKDEELVKGKYYFVMTKTYMRDHKIGGQWFIKVISVSLDKNIIEDEVYISKEEEFKIHGRNKFKYKEVLKKGAVFYELTDEEVEEWKMKITESMI